MNIDFALLQRKLKGMIGTFHGFCENNNIRYFIASGTLLGAIRHRDFIPWDDDIDIYMLRDDYDMLVDELWRKLPEPLELRCFKNFPKIPTHYAKLIDKSTTLIENKFSKYVEGVYIDVFPLDAIDPNSLLDKIKWKCSRFLNSVLLSKYQTTKKKGIIKELARVISRYVSARFLHAQIEKMITARNKTETTFVGDYLGAYNTKEIFPKYYFEECAQLQFGSLYLWGTQFADEYLTQLYGNYMELPPPDERVPKHDLLLIDFFNSYKDYKYPI